MAILEGCHCLQVRQRRGYDFTAEKKEARDGNNNGHTDSLRHHYIFQGFHKQHSNHKLCFLFITFTLLYHISFMPWRSLPSRVILSIRTTTVMHQNDLSAIQLGTWRPVLEMKRIGPTVCLCVLDCVCVLVLASACCELDFIIFAKREHLPAHTDKKMWNLWVRLSDP